MEGLRTMAANWIKVCHDTPRKPEILRVARLSGLHPDEVFGITMRLWLWVDQVSHDGELTGLTIEDCHAAVTPEARHERYINAIISVGWLAQRDDGTIYVPNFDRHNGLSAKARAQSVERQRKKRSQGEGICHASVTEMSRSQRDKNVTLLNLPLISSSSSSSSDLEPSREYPSEGDADENVNAKPTPSEEETANKPRRRAGYTPEFERFWSAYYVNRVGKAEAFKAWGRAIKGADPEAITAAAKSYSDIKTECGDKFICHPSTWLNQGRWEDDPETWYSEDQRARRAFKRRLLEQFPDEPAMGQGAAS